VGFTSPTATPGNCLSGVFGCDWLLTTARQKNMTPLRWRHGYE
jgi:hypothetical protein